MTEILLFLVPFAAGFVFGAVWMYRIGMTATEEAIEEYLGRASGE